MLIVGAVTVEILSVPLILPTFEVADTTVFNLSLDTWSFWLTTISVAERLYSSLSARTFTVTFTVSFEPSGYVTVTTPALSPGPVVVLGVVAHMYVVPAGKFVLFTFVAASGVAP